MEYNVLDHVDQLHLNGEATKAYGNELRTLAYLSEGLAFLNAQVTNIERTVYESLDPTKRVGFFGNHPAMRELPQGLVASAFHWYAVSACNYVRLVGWLANSEDATQALNYVKSVMPEVYMWRNKVGAHFARVKPDRSDSIADLLSSVMFPIVWDDDAFWAGALTLAVRRSGVGSSSRTDMKWSLTDTHRKLTMRYWPTMAGEHRKEREATHAKSNRN